MCLSVATPLNMTNGTNEGFSFSPDPNPAWVGSTLVINGVPMLVNFVAGSNVYFTTNWLQASGDYPYYALSPAGMIPPYWDGSEGDLTGTLVAGDRFGGFFYQMPFGGNALIQQGVYQDQFGGTILQPNTAYYVRVSRGNCGNANSVET